MIDTVLKMMGKGRPEAEGRDIFSNLLLTSTFERGLEGIEPARLARFAQEAFSHVMRKPHKRHAIHFRSTDLLAGAGFPTLTVVEILNDDMPFVVESVTAELHSLGWMPQLVFHPIFKVKRYGSGSLQAVAGPGDQNWGAGDQESYIAILVQPIDDAGQSAVAQALDVVLDHVRNSQLDLEAIRGRIAQAITAFDVMQHGIKPGPGMPSALDVKEAVEFLRWLGQGNFTLLGARDYELVGMEPNIDLWPSSGAGLGVFRRPNSSVPGEAIKPGSTKPGSTKPGSMSAPMRALYAAPSVLILSKSNVLSHVRRRVPLDSIGIKRFNAAGKLLGELRVVGLFTPAAYLQPVEKVPLLRHKVRRVLADAKFPPDSHNGRTLIDILEHFPRDALLQIEQSKLLDWSMRLLDLALRPRTRVLARRDDIGRSDTVLVYVPRDHYSSKLREAIARYLETQLGGGITDFQPYFTASPLVRILFTVGHPAALQGDVPEQVPDQVREQVLEQGIAELARSWDERLSLAIGKQFAGERASNAMSTFRGAFSAGYIETYSVERAVEDILRIERLGPERPAAIDFYREPGAPANTVRAAIYRYDTPIPLSERVPLLENLGFRVIDERSHHVRPILAGHLRDVVLHDMVLESADGSDLDPDQYDVRLEEAFLAVFHGLAENDVFNALVMAAGLDWREAVVMRAYGAYMRQIRAPFSPRYVAETLVRYPVIARDLYALFRARFAEPAQSEPTLREATSASIRQRIEDALQHVTGLDEDRIIRRLLNLVAATVRTNVFQQVTVGEPPATLAFKIASRDVDRLPEPKPYREIFVYSPRVEGVHLRFAPIARGGIRWSDRAQDFRTEVLGLAKAQQVKNTVIVPSGAKGGFVPKQIKRNATREEIQAEGVACYRTFIEALFTLTDNIRDGNIVPPDNVVRFDGDDPYLVVAADKGTATFSDYANEISLRHKFWLGDAFASGGSAGYDHKRMGITARGAWENVRRHFREMDVDIQARPFRVVGVGDMSGDVFGNGMVLSKQIRLVAAFDHRDIFLDPAPDLDASFTERKRLFELPRSSWADYDRAKISAGGGVFSRTAKSIPLSPEMKALLGVDASALAPADLMQAILRCDTDLLWFGGIGTFIRDSQESDDQAGDRANDAIRISAVEVRAKVIGEGANLGVTQRGRIEAALRGVRLNTDFIDNSAGVNTSDQEVNIKIALEPAIASGRLSREDRDKLLAAMAPEVAVAVLANNHGQGLALSLAERTCRRDIDHLAALARQLETRGLIDRKLEALPTGVELTARAAAGDGLTRPELAVLLSWAKIALNADLVTSNVPDAPDAAGRLLAYFPHALRESYGADIAAHRLRREIVATGITNTIINTGGPAVMVRLAAETGEAVEPIVGAFLAARSIFGISALWDELSLLDGRIPSPLQLDLYAALQDLSIGETVRVLQLRHGRSFAEMIAQYQPAVREIGADLADILPVTERVRFETEMHRLTAAGVPAASAARLAGLENLSRAMPLADRAVEAQAGVGETARVTFAVADFLRLGELHARAREVQANDDFDRKAIASGLAIVDNANHSICNRILHDAKGRGLPFEAWAAANAPAVMAAKPGIDKVLAEPGLSIARLSVIADSLRSFV